MKYIHRLIIFGLVGLMAAGNASVAAASEVTGSLSNEGAAQQANAPNTIASPIPVATNTQPSNPYSPSVFSSSWLPQNVDNDFLIKLGFVAILASECLILLMVAMAKRRRRKFLSHPTPAK